MSNNKLSKRLDEISDWFYDQSCKSFLASIAYSEASRKVTRATKALKRATKAMWQADLLAQEILESHVAETESSPEVPMAANRDAHKEMWAKWFAEQQAEMDAEAAEAAKEDSDEATSTKYDPYEE